MIELSPDLYRILYSWIWTWKLREQTIRRFLLVNQRGQLGVAAESVVESMIAVAAAVLHDKPNIVACIDS